MMPTANVSSAPVCGGARHGQGARRTVRGSRATLVVSRPRPVEPLLTPDAFALYTLCRSRMMGHEFPSLRAAWIRS